MKILFKGAGYMAKQKAIYVKVSEEQHQRYKEYAVKNKTDISNLVRMAVEEYMERGDNNGLGRTTEKTD